MAVHDCYLISIFVLQGPAFILILIMVMNDFCVFGTKILFIKHPSFENMVRVSLRKVQMQWKNTVYHQTRVEGHIYIIQYNR